jgi:hypothetical protein
VKAVNTARNIGIEYLNRTIYLFQSWIELAFVDGLCSIILYLIYNFESQRWGLPRFTFLDVYLVVFGADMLIRTLK